LEQQRRHEEKRRDSEQSTEIDLTQSRLEETPESIAGAAEVSPVCQPNPDVGLAKEEPALHQGGSEKVRSSSP